MIISEKKIRLLIDESLKRQNANKALRETIVNILDENSSCSTTLSEDDLRCLIVEKLKAGKSAGGVRSDSSSVSRDSSSSGDDVGLEKKGSHEPFEMSKEIHPSEWDPDVASKWNNISAQTKKFIMAMPAAIASLGYAKDENDAKAMAKRIIGGTYRSNAEQAAAVYGGPYLNDLQGRATGCKPGSYYFAGGETCSAKPGGVYSTSGPYADIFKKYEEITGFGNSPSLPGNWKEIWQSKRGAAKAAGGDILGPDTGKGQGHGSGKAIDSGFIDGQVAMIDKAASISGTSAHKFKEVDHLHLTVTEKRDLMITESIIRDAVSNILDEKLRAGKSAGSAIGRIVQAISSRVSNKDIEQIEATGGGNADAALNAEEEIIKWSGKTENDHPARGGSDPEIKAQLDAYWNAGRGGSQWPGGPDDHWSAAFISFTMNDPSWKSSTAHKTYMQDARDNRDKAISGENVSNKFVAYKPGEKQPARGDVICRPRGTGDGWDNIGPANHCDVYLGNGNMIGGNLSDTVASKTYSPPNATMIISKGASINLAESNKKIQATESELRNLIREKLTAAKSMGKSSRGAGRAARRFDSDGKGCEGEGPITSSKYPQSAIKVIEKWMDNIGIKRRCTRIAVLAVLAKESGLVPKSEKCYDTTSNSRIRKIFGSRVSPENLPDGKTLDELKSDCEAFFNHVYGPKFYQKYGHTDPGDGYKYRGRGLNQITFKKSYEKYGFASNPDALNEIEGAAEAAVKFLSARLKSKHGSVDPPFKDQAEANREVAHANAGLGHRDTGPESALGRAISSTNAAASAFS